jgi:DNA-binding PadR family transcriptional regulator
MMYGHSGPYCAGRGGGGRHFGGRHGFFRGPFGGGFRGGGMRTARMLGAGDLQLLILLLLSEKARHGYEIIKAIEEHSSGAYTPSPGMVYPALTYLEEMGYANTSTEGAKKLYSITSEGSAFLDENRGLADEMWSRLALFGRKLAHLQRQYAEDEAVADHFGSGTSSSARAEWQQLKAEFLALRAELKAAIYEKLNSSMEEKRRVLQILRRTIDDIRGKQTP